MPSLQERSDLKADPVNVKDLNEELSPTGYLGVKVEGEELRELEGWVKGHLLRITADMKETTDRFMREDNQFEGKMPGADYPYIGAFRINYPVTKKKVREIANKLKEAFLQANPMWAITSDDPELRDYADDVEIALDKAVMKDIEADDDLMQAFLDAVKHGIGALVAGWDYMEETVRDVETYEGFDGHTTESLEGMQAFEKNYPDWKDTLDGREMHRKIQRGNDVTMEVSYRIPIKNSPILKHIPAKDLRVYPKTNGFAGLRSTPMYGYVETFYQQDLRWLADQEVIDEKSLHRIFKLEGVDKNKENDDAYKDSKEYEVFIGTIRYKLPGDEEPVRYKVWFETKTGVILRLRHFPWWNVQPDLIPLYCRAEVPGFFKPGYAEDLKDVHQVLNALLNMFLNACDMLNSMRFKAQFKSVGYQHLLARRWSPHVAVPWKDDPKEVESMNAASNHIAPLMDAIKVMQQVAEDNSGTSSGQSGQDSPTDPSAPASKTLMLLQQVEPNLKDAIFSLDQGMRHAGRWVLALYYQGMSLGWIENLPGIPDMPKEILRQMIDELETRATLFESDRNGRMERNLEVFQLITASRSDLIPKALKVVISQMDSQWKELAEEWDLDNPPPPAPMPVGQPGQPAPGSQPTPGQPQPKVKPQLSMGGGASNGNGNSPISLLARAGYSS